MEQKVAGNNLLREKKKFFIFWWNDSIILLLVLCISSVHERDVLVVKRDVTKGKIHLLPRADSIFLHIQA